MRHLLTTIFILISSTALASNLTQAADSLLGVLKNTQSPEQRVQIYRNLADIYSESPEARTYLLKMYQEASTINDRKSMLNALDDILTTGIYDYNKDTIAKYTKLFEKIATEEELKSLLPFYRMRTFDSRCYSGERDKAIKEEISSQNSKANGKEDIYNQVVSAYNMGTSFYMSDQYAKAIPYLDKAMKLAESLPEKDKYIYKKPAADVLMGLTSKMLYKDWDFSFSLRASLNNYVYYDFLSNKANVSASGLYTNNAYVNTTKEAIALGFTGKGEYYMSDYFVRNASFIRCDNITLGYSFKNLLRSQAYQGVGGRVFATVQNPFVISKYKGLDPEIKSGIDSNPYPRATTFLLGLSLQF